MDPIYSRNYEFSPPSIGLTIQGNTLNTLDNGYSLDAVGDQEQGASVAGNTYLGSSQWLVSNGDQTVDTSSFSDYQNGMQTLFDSDWDSSPGSQVGGVAGEFDINGLFAEMDSNPNWLGAPDVLRNYAAEVINAAGGTPVTEGTLTPPDATEDVPFTQTVFHFCDADPNTTAGDYTAVVTPGDGNTATLTGTAGPEGEIVADPAGGFDVVLSYTYATSIQAVAGAAFGVLVTNNSDGATTVPDANCFAVRATLRRGGGSGNWTDTNWYEGNSSVPETWISGSAAVFPSTAVFLSTMGGTADATPVGSVPDIQLSGPVAVYSLDLQGNYALDGDSLSLLSANTTIDVESTAAVTISCDDHRWRKFDQDRQWHADPFRGK